MLTTVRTWYSLSFIGCGRDQARSQEFACGGLRFTSEISDDLFLGSLVTEFFLFFLLTILRLPGLLGPVIATHHVQQISSRRSLVGASTFLLGLEPLSPITLAG